jgi:DNA-binding GntR family transcriptional regulator
VALSPNAPGDRVAKRSPVSNQGLALLADQVYEELLDAVVERRLPPGTRLIPGNLARDLGVSATPVKLALTRLIADGLVTGLSRRGVFVAQHDSAQLEDLFRARLFLETSVAQQFFDRVTPSFADGLGRAATAYADLAVTGGDHNRRQLGDLDRDFHRLIVRLADNEHITRWYEQANVHIQGHRSVVPRERYEATIREHDAIVGAFVSGSVNLAVDALQIHLANAKAHLLLMLQTAAAQAPRVRRLRSDDARKSPV